MNASLATMKLTHFTRTYGEMTYAEVVKLAKDTEETLSHLPATDVAFEYFAKCVRAYWQYAELLAIVGERSDIDHLYQKHYLCGWDSIVSGKQKKTKFTEELEFYIPRYNRSQYEQQRVMCEAIGKRFNTYVTPDLVEFMEL